MPHILNHIPHIPLQGTIHMHVLVDLLMVDLRLYSIEYCLKIVKQGDQNVFHCIIQHFFYQLYLIHHRISHRFMLYDHHLVQMHQL